MYLWVPRGANPAGPLLKLLPPWRMEVRVLMCSEKKKEKTLYKLKIEKKPNKTASTFSTLGKLFRTRRCKAKNF